MYRKNTSFRKRESGINKYVNWFLRRQLFAQNYELREYDGSFVLVV